MHNLVLHDPLFTCRFPSSYSRLAAEGRCTTMRMGESSRDQNYPTSASWVHTNQPARASTAFVTTSPAVALARRRLEIAFEPHNTTNHRSRHFQTQWRRQVHDAEVRRPARSVRLPVHFDNHHMWQENGNHQHRSGECRSQVLADDATTVYDDRGMRDKGWRRVSSSEGRHDIVSIAGGEVWEWNGRRVVVQPAGCSPLRTTRIGLIKHAEVPAVLAAEAEEGEESEIQHTVDNVCEGWLGERRLGRIVMVRRDTCDVYVGRCGTIQVDHTQHDGNSDSFHGK